MARSPGKIATAAALALVAFASPSAQVQPARAALEAQQWTVGSLKRTGFVALPTRRSPAGAPLVLVFHGHGGKARNMARALPIHAKWPEAIVVYLQGVPTSGPLADPEGRRAGWQSKPGDLGDRDLVFVDTVLAWASRNYDVDGKRIFAAGHSNGGWFTYVLWATRADKFAAFAPAAAIFGSMIEQAKPKPALIIAGEKDRLVPFAQQRRTIDAVIRLNQAAVKGEPWFGAADMHQSRVADVVTYVHPGAHPLPPDASDIVARFFRNR
jgi:polyhydroxybutyrate depolymerase